MQLDSHRSVVWATEATCGELLQGDACKPRERKGKSFFYPLGKVEQGLGIPRQPLANLVPTDHCTLVQRGDGCNRKLPEWTDGLVPVSVTGGRTGVTRPKSQLQLAPRDEVCGWHGSRHPIRL